MGKLVNFMQFVEHDGIIGEFVGGLGENHGKWRKKWRIFENFDGKGGCLKGRRGQREDEKASNNFINGDWGPLGKTKRKS